MATGSARRSRQRVHRQRVRVAGHLINVDVANINFRTLKYDIKYIALKKIYCMTNLQLKFLLLLKPIWSISPKHLKQITIAIGSHNSTVTVGRTCK